MELFTAEHYEEVSRNFDRQKQKYRERGMYSLAIFCGIQSMRYKKKAEKKKAMRTA